MERAPEAEQKWMDAFTTNKSDAKLVPSREAISQVRSSEFSKQRLG